MALKLGELVAYIRADGPQFDQQIERSGTKFEALGRTVGTGVQAIARSFAAITTAGVAVGVAGVKIGADCNRLQQSSRAALTTLLGSAEAANAQMDRLDEFARVATGPITPLLSPERPTDHAVLLVGWVSRRYLITGPVPGVRRRTAS